MTKYSLVAVTAFLAASLAGAEQLRGSDSNDSLQQRLDALEALVKKHDKTISMLEKSVEEHAQTISGLGSRHLEGGSNCYLAYEDEMCVLMKPEDHMSRKLEIPVEVGEPEPEPVVEKPADLLVKGKTYVMDGMVVEAGDCDNCIVFKDDVVFDDNVKFIDPVIFEDPVKFFQDVLMKGPEVPSSYKTSKISDDFSSLDFVTKEYMNVKLDQDETFIVFSKSRFEKDVLLDVKSPSSSDVPPNLKVVGTITEVGATEY